MRYEKAAVTALSILIACSVCAGDVSSRAKMVVSEKIMHFRSGMTNHVMQVVSYRVVWARVYNQTG